MMGTASGGAAAGRKSKKGATLRRDGTCTTTRRSTATKAGAEGGRAGRVDTAAEDDGETPDVLPTARRRRCRRIAEAMVGDLHDAALRNASYSRRRTFHEEADVVHQQA